jgi:hypothetical protein
VELTKKKKRKSKKRKKKKEGQKRKVAPSKKREPKRKKRKKEKKKGKRKRTEKKRDAPSRAHRASRKVTGPRAGQATTTGPGSYTQINKASSAPLEISAKCTRVHNTVVTSVRVHVEHNGPFVSRVISTAPQQPITYKFPGGSGESDESCAKPNVQSKPRSNSNERPGTPRGT